MSMRLLAPVSFSFVFSINSSAFRTSSFDWTRDVTSECTLTKCVIAPESSRNGVSEMRFQNGVPSLR